MEFKMRYVDVVVGNQQLLRYTASASSILGGCVVVGNQQLLRYTQVQILPDPFAVVVGNQQLLRYTPSPRGPAID